LRFHLASALHSLQTIVIVQTRGTTSGAYSQVDC